MNKRCIHCGLLRWHHYESWVNEILCSIIPTPRIPYKIEHFVGNCIEQLFVLIRLMQFRDVFELVDVQPRLQLFVEEGRKQGITFRLGVGPMGPTSQMRMVVNGKEFSFEKLPTASFVGKVSDLITNSKQKTKDHLSRGGFPVPKGKSFWFWGRGRAVRYGLTTLGVPLVVKPVNGSVARHVLTDVRGEKALREAIDVVLLYGPHFMVEQYIADAHVFRGTVIDQDYVACVEQVPAFVVGDGTQSIRELAKEKERSWEKLGFADHIVFNETTNNILAERGLSLDAVPPRGVRVDLQRDSFMKLGGELVERTNEMHPENKKLFQDIAKHFDMRLVGIDVMIEDIRRPWQEQVCAVLELNSVPAFDMHHKPHSGASQNVAQPLVAMVKKYYV